MPEVIDNILRDQLLERREKLQYAAAHSSQPGQVYRLLGEVDAALGRLEEGSYGVCECCHQPIEADRLLADPLLRFCLCELTDGERDALERDLQLAAQIQRGLLPPKEFLGDPWHAAYHYQPAGLVSGDYCDLVDAGERGLYFMVGDVSGKGVAASMLTAHLHAMFRALIPVGLSLKGMLEHASRVFSQSTLPTHYATLVCGRALPDGKLEISNAGHPAPLIAANGKVAEVDATNLPVGMFGAEEFAVTELRLEPGHALIVYSDGISEAMNRDGIEYGVERLRRVIERARDSHPSRLVNACRDDLMSFCGQAQRHDDMTLFVLSRT